MNSYERHVARYQRRKKERELHKEERSEALGGLGAVCSFDKLFSAGKKCCNGYRWKTRIQIFEMDLFVNTAVLCRKLEKDKWKPEKYNHFTTMERGKPREIDAPTPKDRQLHKAITTNAIMPLYMPSIIKNNSASLKGRGLDYAWDRLRDDLQAHFRKYAREGWVIIIDYTGFFPNALHQVVYDRHERYIRDEQIKEIANKIIGSIKGGRGMPLGVELSQSEMVAYPSALDNYIKCQMGIKGMGHYMDDYYVIVPPTMNPKEVLDTIADRAARLGLTVNLKKTKIIPLTKWFKFCKVKFLLTETGKVVRCGNSKNMQVVRRKIKMFKRKFDAGEIEFESIRESLQSCLAYFKRHNNHNKVLKIYRIFYAVFGFSFELVEKKSKGVNGVCSISSLEHFKERPLLGEHSRSQEELPVKP